MRIPLLVATAAGYLMGTIPVARTVARRHGVDDLRCVGDRNPGAWNTMQLVGVRAALPVFVGDTAKGAVAAAIGTAAGRHWWAPYLTGGAAMVGHAFPITDRFSGGRSVLTFVGAAAVAAPRPAAVSAAIAAAAWTATGRFDTAARAGVTVFPAVQLATDGARRTAATGLLMTFVGLRFAQAAITEERRTGDRAS